MSDIARSPVVTDAGARRPIESLADIDAIERQPYETSVPVRSVPEIIERSARLFASDPAITYLPSGDLADAPSVVTYADLHRLVIAAANVLHGAGIGPGDAVALLLPPVPEAHVALWAAETAAIACPINTLLGAEHIAAIMTAAGAKALVAYGPHEGFDIWDKVAEIRRRVPELRIVLQVGGPVTDPSVRDLSRAIEIARCDALAFARPLGRDVNAALYHTGGTTGLPKLARHTHGNQAHTSWLAGLYYDLRPGDAMLCGFPLFHVAGAFVYGASTFAAGANLVLPTALGMRDKGFVDAVWRFVERHRITHLAAVPTVLAMLLGVPVGDARIGSIRLALTGGSPLPDELAAQFEQRLSIPVRNILGMTESAGLVSIIPAALPRKPGSCGLRLPYTHVHAARLGPGGEALIGEAGGPGESGVIVLSGPHISPGYTDAARNAGTFTADGWLISGDLGYVDADGEVHVTGRAKDVIIRGAHNIDPAVIEEAVLKHPAVEMAAAVGEPDAHAGELPVVFVKLKPGATATGEAILATAAPLIPERPAIPKRCTILDALPLTAIGKIYKPSLRTLAIGQAYREALAKAAVTATVTVLETGGGHRVRIAVAPGAGDAVRAAVGGLAVPFEISADA